MKTWRLIAGVVLLLVFGMLIGSMGAHFYLRHRYHFSLDRKDRTVRLLKHLSRELDLSQEQRTAAEHILQQMSEKLHALYIGQFPEAERIVDESFSEIRKRLTDEQKKKFDAMQELYRKRRHWRER